MPVVRNKSGLERVHIDNLNELSVSVDDLEGLQTIANTKLTSIDAKIPTALTGSGNLKVCIQELGNEGSERLNVDVGSTVSQLPSALTGEGNLKVSIQEDFTHNLSTSAKQDTQITHLSEIEGAVETLEGCVGSNKVNVNISSVGAGGISTEAKQDALISANHTDLAALEASLTSMEAKMDTDNVVYDNQLTKLTEIDTAIDTIDGVLDSSLTKQGEIETSLNSLISANHTDLAALEASLTSMEGKY